MKNFENGFSNKLGLFALAKKSKKQRQVVWFFVFAFLVTFIGATPAEILNWGANKLYDFPAVFDITFFSLMLGFGTVSLIIFAIVKYKEKRPIRDLGFIKGNIGQKYIRGFGEGLLMMGGCALIIYSFGGFELVTKGENIGLSSLPIILFIALGWIIQGATEEVIARGWMMPLLGHKYNVPFAILITSLYFTVLHFLNGHLNLIPITNLFLYGVFAALYVIKNKNLWGICGLHSSWNWMQSNILGVQVSGQTYPGGSIVKLSAQGNDLISGGEFGIEGSLICTIVLLILSLFLVSKIIKDKTYINVVSAS